MSALMQRRWRAFKSHKRGWFSACLLLFVCSVAVFAPFIANEKPLMVYYEKTFYFPIFNDYPETVFGGILETETQYREHFIQQKIKEKGGWMLFPLIPYSSFTVNYDAVSPAPAAPSADNWLGTDDHGRDVLSRLIYGLRTSLFFSFTLTFFSIIIGLTIGAIQGYCGGWIDLIGQRFLEIWSGLPVLYLLIILASMIEPHVGWLLFIMLLFSWLPLVQVVRAEFLRARHLDYVQAARVLGVPTWAILVRHILPNAMVTTLTYIPFNLNYAIVTLTSLDFLGFGLPPGSASLGELIHQGKNNIYAPWLGLTAFFALAFLLTLLVFVGEAIREAFDPQKS